MKVTVLNARLSFHDLAEPVASTEGAKPKYSIKLICSDETQIKVKGKDGEPKILAHSNMLAVMDKVVKEKFNKLCKDMPKLCNWVYNKADGSNADGFTTRKAFCDGEGNYYSGTDESTYLIDATKRADKARNGIRIVDQKKEDVRADSAAIYSGMYVNVVIDVYANEVTLDGGGKTKNVAASLELIQIARDGEPIGAAPLDPNEEFDELEVSQTAATPGSEGEDDIPF